jgi:putative NADPH-quinone reductase
LETFALNIYLLLAHPDIESFNGRIADAYEKAALEAGHTIRRQNLGDMKFDPILWKGYKDRQPLEPDLISAQQNILWCNHWVIVYPMWWGSVPALFKGFLDRTLLSGFAYKYHDKGPLWDKLLTGRSAQLISTSDAPWWWIWLMYRNSDTNMLKHAVLNFCGIAPVKATRIDNVRQSDYRRLTQQLKKVSTLVPKLT